MFVELDDDLKTCLQGLESRYDVKVREIQKELMGIEGGDIDQVKEMVRLFKDFFDAKVRWKAQDIQKVRNRCQEECASYAAHYKSLKEHPIVHPFFHELEPLRRQLEKYQTKLETYESILGRLQVLEHNILDGQDYNEEDSIRDLITTEYYNELYEEYYSTENVSLSSDDDTILTAFEDLDFIVWLIEKFFTKIDYCQTEIGITRQRMEPIEDELRENNVYDTVQKFLEDEAKIRRFLNPPEKDFQRLEAQYENYVVRRMDDNLRLAIIEPNFILRWNKRTNATAAITADETFLTEGKDWLASLMEDYRQECHVQLQTGAAKVEEIKRTDTSAAHDLRARFAGADRTMHRAAQGYMKHLAYLMNQRVAREVADSTTEEADNDFLDEMKYMVNIMKNNSLKTRALAVDCCFELMLISRREKEILYSN